MSEQPNKKSQTEQNIRLVKVAYIILPVLLLALALNVMLITGYSSRRMLLLMSVGTGILMIGALRRVERGEPIISGREVGTLIKCSVLSAVLSAAGVAALLALIFLGVE